MTPDSGDSVVHRTSSGMIFRVIETLDGGLRVEVLRGGSWVPGGIGIVGLRLDRSTRKLSAAAVRALPA